MSYNDFGKYKAIEDTVIQPIQRFLEGKVEGAKTKMERLFTTSAIKLQYLSARRNLLVASD